MLPTLLLYSFVRRLHWPAHFQLALPSYCHPRFTTKKGVELLTRLTYSIVHRLYLQAHYSWRS
jgi:hypothetical protein